MNHTDPNGALQSAARGGRCADFWEWLPSLTDGAPPAPRADRPPSAFLSAVRSRIAHRRSPETRAFFRTVAHLAGARVQAMCAEHFADVLKPDERGAIVQGLYTELFDGGLAQFQGADADELLAFVQLCADRAVLRAAVAKWALFEVRAARGARYRDLLSQDEVEELGADVISELLSRALARFEGTNDRQLYVYVRTTAHRAVSRAARRRILDRDSVTRMRNEAPPDSPPLLGRPPSSPRVRLRPSDPLPISQGDREYIEDLLAAGGKLSSLAEARGVSRGSVTKMVQRIMGRLDSLPMDDRERVGEWAEATLADLQAAP